MRKVRDPLSFTLHPSTAMSLEPSHSIWPGRASVWQLRTRSLTFGTRPAVMGIVNVTPDSFSDGGRYNSTDRAIVHAEKLIAEGADVLDVGGESTRPYADPVTADEELRRVAPVLERLCRDSPVPVSIDTAKAVVARHAVEAGAEIINDVTALTSDPSMIQIALESQAGVCAMHMQGTPQTMQDAPRYGNVVADIHNYLRQQRDQLWEAKIERGQLCLDPGIGFGKTHQHNLDLVAGCARFHDLGCPLLVGPSRKGFIGKVLGDRDAGRIPATIGVCLTLARFGVQVLRVHDVAAVKQALLLFESTGGVDGRSRRLEDV
jgi:dihydropteroate synthase